jgi:hypothetical protein
MMIHRLALDSSLTRAAAPAVLPSVLPPGIPEYGRPSFRHPKRNPASADTLAIAQQVSPCRI